MDLRRLADAVLLPGFVGTSAPDWVRRRVAEGLGGVLLFGRNVVDDEQVTALAAQLRAERPEVVVAIDEESGDVTRLDAGRGSAFPGPHALGAVGDVALTERVGAALGARLAACGVTVTLAPCADLTLAAQDPIIGVRAFGSSPEPAAEQVAAFIRGIQSAGVAACAKHFPGHGAATADSHLELPVLERTDAQLRSVELVPFRSAIAAGVRSVMTGHLVVPEWGEQPATLNRYALSEVLRGELGFGGAIVTDALEMNAVSGTAGMTDGAVQALRAGADLLCVGGEPMGAELVDALADAIVAAVHSGRLAEERLVEAAERASSLGGPVPSNAYTPSDLGLQAARRALEVRGEIKLAGPPLVVDLAVDPSIAVGAVPWGLGPHLAELLPGTRVLAGGPGSRQDILDSVNGSPLVVVTRDAHRHAEVRQLVVELVSIGLDLVHVETGVPGPDLGSVARIDTHGGAYVCLRAAAELLADHTAGEDKG
ncbi:beta-N-acetylhexosaminidase [Crossiella equi]|uniref:Beta-N-acetylhexosaminidase n=1 Tax=Crossiella equi TaxID=130796 RepID=A0ABS5AES8_9PSEU|nr:beta-N-acetylhexosaminidase [Crossiella equi]MBP2475093.1 beta-N-acetylhexosaminidase [Crossiella equi]